jgi:hypothetical protein
VTSSIVFPDDPPSPFSGSAAASPDAGGKQDGNPAVAGSGGGGAKAQAPLASGRRRSLRQRGSEAPDPFSRGQTVRWRPAPGAVGISAASGVVAETREIERRETQGV